MDLVLSLTSMDRLTRRSAHEYAGALRRTFECS